MPALGGINVLVVLSPLHVLLVPMPPVVRVFVLPALKDRTVGLLLLHIQIAILVYGLQLPQRLPLLVLPVPLVLNVVAGAKFRASLELTRKTPSSYTTSRPGVLAM
jgi:hypothetical protein